MVFGASVNSREINTRFLDIQTEINYLGQLQHPNLVKLIGYCLEDEHRLLVYEFMPKGSMENHLFRSEFLASSIVANDNHFEPYLLHPLFSFLEKFAALFI